MKFYSKVAKIEHKKKIARAWKEGDETKTEEEDLGWFILLEGSWEYLYVGNAEPKEFKVGDEVEVIINPKQS